MLLLKNSENLPPSVRFGLNNIRNVFYSLNQQWQLLDQVVAVVLDDKHLHYQQWQLLDQVVAVVWVTNTYIIDNGSSWTKW
ncbi:hypothetical protein ACOMHN_023037 [Nucella lapillus]